MKFCSTYIKRVATCLAALCFFAAFGANADTVILKEDAYIKGPKVLLGEVADIEGDQKEFLETVELAVAALPGELRRVNASLVYSRVKHAGIETEGLEVKGARMVRATTLHQDLPATLIAEDLRMHIESEMPWELVDTEIEVAVPSGNLIVPDGALELVWHANPQYAYVGAGTFRGQVVVDGQVQKSIQYRASVEPYVDVVVSRRDIPRGKLIALSDLEAEKRRLSALKKGVFLCPEEVAGFVARATIFPGQVITASKITPRKVIKRNQIVTVEAQVGSMKLSSMARARSDACEGDLVLCVNLDSKEEFQGVVRADGVVIVQ